MEGRVMTLWTRVSFSGSWCLFVLLSACAKTPPPETVDEDPAGVLEDDEAAAESSEPPAAASEASAESEQPTFTPGMSVEEAISAVPSDAQRIHIEEEALAEPLKDPALYEPCKLKGHEHFSIRVGVWQGRAVGLDVTTKPVNAELASCLRTQIERIEWKDKVESLNTVEFNY
jgi:hypothetical protein